ncbi:MAG: hypothetical protein ACO233_02905 [Candidatus Fonsibacter ubiquis]
MSTVAVDVGTDGRFVPITFSTTPVATTGGVLNPKALAEPMPKDNGLMI